MTSLEQLPDNLPKPLDDGACQHLYQLPIPSVPLAATNGETINLSSLKAAVIYCYPMTGQPDRPLPDGWDQIPGARGCTPQSCSFRDHYSELQALGYELYGLSTQSSDEQREAKKRLHLPFELLSDTQLGFSRAIGLPSFQIDDVTFLKRVTLILQAGIIKKVFYPVFPPDKNADEVIAFLLQK